MNHGKKLNVTVLIEFVSVDNPSYSKQNKNIMHRGTKRVRIDGCYFINRQYHIYLYIAL